MKKIMPLVVVILSICAIQLGGRQTFAAPNISNPSQLEIAKITTDKAVYTPSSGQAQISITLKNKSVTYFSGEVNGQLSLYWSGSQVTSTQQNISFKGLSLLAGQTSGTLTVNIPLPAENLKGYLIQVDLEDSQGRDLQGTSALDVSTDPTKFPRYGAETYYGMDTTLSKKILTDFKDAHFNLVLNYDWFDGNNPQNPLPANKISWYDTMGHPVNKSRIIAQNQAMNDVGIVPMAYNMANAVVTDESAGYHPYGWYYGIQNQNKITKDGVDYTSMGLKNDGELSSPLQGGGGGNRQWFQVYKQLYMNMGNDNWQDLIYKNMNTAIDNLGFKGWQMDIAGLWGRHFSVDNQGQIYGGPFSQAINFSAFVNNYRRTNPNALIGWNSEGQGVGEIYRSQPNSLLNSADLAYSELWDGDRALANDGTNSGSMNSTYDALKENIDATRKLTSQDGSYGRSLVIANYQQRGNLNPQNGTNTINEAGELLSNAVIGAAGGSRLNLVNGFNVIYSEYHSEVLYESTGLGGKTAATSDSLKTQEQNYQNFMVAYENFLRDGQEDNQNPIRVKTSSGSEQVSDKQSEALVGNQIQGFARSTKNAWAEGTDTINLINWKQVQGNAPDADARLWGESYKNSQGNLVMNPHNKPTKQVDLTLQYYSDKVFTSGFVTSPDTDYQGRPTLLSKEGDYSLKEVPSDIAGKHKYEIKVPSLDYWDLIVLKP